MSDGPHKARVYDALIDALKRRIAQTQQVIQHAQGAATDAEAKAENKYDTRGLEMSFVAAGQTDRVAQLRQVLSAFHFWTPPGELEEVRPGALVLLVAAEPSEQGAAEDERWLYVSPYGDATRLEVDGHQVQVITLKAPVGRALVGKQAGDEVQAMGRGWVVEQVA